MALDSNVTLGRSRLRVSPMCLGKMTSAHHQGPLGEDASKRSRVMLLHGGTTINGRSAEPWPMSPNDDSDRC